jgi:hypothetical protein
MNRAIAVILAMSLAALGLGAATAVAQTTSPVQVVDPDVVTPQGLARIEIGDARADLQRDHGLAQRPGDCAPRLPDHPSASPVFDDDRLVLLWADPPLRTPDGIAVGTPVTEVRSTHPDAEPLTAPPGSYRFDGLLAVNGDRAYLFLHDGDTVQKLVVGSAEHARALFHEGFGTC